MKYLYVLLILVILNIYSVYGIEIIYPTESLELCSSTPVEITWNGNADNIIVWVKSEQNSEFQKIINYEIIGNTLKWKVSVEEFFNVPLTFRISNGSNPNDYDEVGGITVYRDVEIIEQTHSLQLCEGEDILLDIEAVGYNLTYQWYKDNVMISNSNSSILYIPNSDYSNSGIYSCRIQSESFCRTKEIAPISVYIATKTNFLKDPKNVFWEYQQNGRMQVILHSNINLSNNVKFQWYKDTTIFVVPEGGGTLVPAKVWLKLQDGKKYIGTQSNDFVVKKMVWGDRAEYFCIAEGLCGIDTAVGMIGAQKYFRIKKNSPDYTGCEGKSVKFRASVETNETGTFTYQWYKVGNIKLEEGEKFSGTNTLELTMNNPDRKDNSNYYVLVSLVEKEVYERSEPFSYNPDYKPLIADQPKNWAIYSPRNYEIGIIYLKMSLYNYEPCYYEWYKGDSLVLSGYGRNVYRKYNVSESNLGWYKCKIRNNCGTIWTDSIDVVWGFQNNKFSACLNSELIVEVDELSDEYYYEWVLNGKVVVDSDRIKNSSTNKLLITNLTLQDIGDYDIYSINKNTLEKKFLGIINIEAEIPPSLPSDLPDMLVNDGEWMPIKSIVAITPGNGIHHILYIDGVAQYDEEFREQDQFGNTDYGFTFGGNNSNLKPGVYQYRFRNECGITWSNKMTVKNTNYKE